LILVDLGLCLLPGCWNGLLVPTLGQGSEGQSTTTGIQSLERLRLSDGNGEVANLSGVFFCDDVAFPVVDEVFHFWHRAHEWQRAI